MRRQAADARRLGLGAHALSRRSQSAYARRVGTRAWAHGESGAWKVVSYGAAAWLGLVVLSCSTNEKAAAPVSPAAQSERGAANALAAWLHGPNPSASAKKGSASESLIGAACISHLGCESAAPPMPQCTPESALPPGYVEVRGELSLSPYITQGGPENVLMCTRTARTRLTLKNVAAEYDLGSNCAGDRTGWCCPYALGTTVRAVGRVSSDRGMSRFDDYWMCAESAPKIPEPVTNAELVAVRLGQPPGKATWAAGSILATWNFEQARLSQIRSDAQKPFVCVDLDPSGKRAFTIDRAGDGAVWSLASGAREATLPDFAPKARTQPFAPDVSCTYQLAEAVAWAGDGDALFTVSASGVGSVYTLSTGAFQKLPSQIPIDHFHYEFFAPDGRALLVDAEGDQLELWQVEPLQKRLVFTGRAGAWSPNGRQLLIRLGAGVGAPVTYQIRDAVDGALHSELPGACLAEWSPNGRYVAAQLPCGTNQIELLDVASGRTIARMAATYRPLWSGRRNAVPQYLPYLAQLLERGSLGRPPPLPELSTDAAHNLLAATNSAGIALRTSNGQRIELKGEIRASSDGLNFDPALEFSPDAKSVIAGTRLWTVSPSGAMPRTVDLPKEVKFLQPLWSPDSRYLALWNWIQQNDEPFETSAKLVVVARDSGRVLMSALPSGHATPQQRVVGLLSPSWLPHRPILVVPIPGNDQLVELWNVARGSRLWFALSLDNGAAAAVSLSGDGRFAGQRELLLRMQQQHPELQLAHELREEPNLVEHFMND